MKVLTVVGARPQFIKAAMVSHEFQQRDDIEEILVHTGQHFDRNMSELFFEQMTIPRPRYNLGVSGGSHTVMTARMMLGLETVIQEESPDLVLLFGDTNSTLAAALTAVKMRIPIAHVEAGPRSRSLKNAEEANRVCTDHLGSVLFAATESGLRNLAEEGLGERAFLVGDLMYDAFLHYSDVVDSETFQPVLVSIDGNPIEIPPHYCYLTCHRSENTENLNALSEILLAASALPYPVIYPVHPRALDLARDVVSCCKLDSIVLAEPVGYLESIFLTKHAAHVITDSGGVQREAFFAKVPCTVPMTIFVWPEIMVDGRCVLVPPERGKIESVLNRTQRIDDDYLPFGDGRAAGRIVDVLSGCSEEVL
ncbi:non-hydrolyzing UDP-N-acetylglucosamine 2-epimerase [Enteroscipio rubneri]|uniref:UDP-N-acetylglucosamine 2-epimerase (Non-hydrolyzing) n=1 Tax=Enteroscipio rubneri TaxID=2070686 RepID=A0A2K2UA50_9ACTN|nr:UDP-N-acetylglucosamine 2-epimerase (non-hydrolyzing) [Enteroscipio rubneri]PNV67196.1 UDP-N-acetylglucosamine 2-epimerase (non-hydrolyzing) [Enteroscipio rubneri]